MTMPALKKACSLPNNFPLTSAGTRSALNARVAGIAMFMPRDLKIIMPVASIRLDEKGNTIDARRDERLPSVIKGFLPITSAVFPAMKLQNTPTNPETDRIMPISKGEA